MDIEAAVLREASEPFQVEALKLDAPRTDEILVQIVAAGMCHTDLNGRSSRLFGGPTIYGHEGAGVVMAVGDSVRNLDRGTHVVLTFDHCGSCRNCRTGHVAHCAQFYELNLAARRLDGSSPVTDASGEVVLARWFGQSSFSNYVIATERNCIPVDRSLPLELLSPLGCSIQTGVGSVLNSLGVRSSSSIAIFGAGAVGLAAVMGSKIVGASTIAAIDLHVSRLELAKELGATHVFDGASETLSSELQQAADEGFEFAIDTTGQSEVISVAVESLRLRGTCGLIGMVQGNLTISRLVGGRRIVAVSEGDSVPQLFIPQLIEFWREGRLPFEKLIHTMPLAFINEAEQKSRSGELVKPVLLMQD